MEFIKEIDDIGHIGLELIVNQVEEQYDCEPIEQVANNAIKQYFI